MPLPWMTQSRRNEKLETLGDMAAVDMTMAEGKAGVGDLEGPLAIVMTPTRELAT